MKAVPDQLYRVKDVCAMFGVSKPRLYVWLAEGNFPRPDVLLPAAGKRWSASALAEFQESRKTTLQSVA